MEPTTGASPDAIELVTSDHRGVEQLFRQLEAATTDDTRLVIGQRIIEELSVHAAIEEQVLYPGTRRILGEDDLVAHAIDEHDRLKQVLADLDGLDPSDDRFLGGFQLARQLVEEHVGEEESDLLPKLRDRGDPEDLQKMGAAMQVAKRIAPTHPHPHAPSTPPGNLVLGPVVALVDRVRDAARAAFAHK